MALVVLEGSVEGKEELIFTRTLLVGLGLFAVACTAEESAKGPASAADAPLPETPPAFVVAPPDWKNCDLVPGQPRGTSQCATVMLPREHAGATSESATIGIALKRIPASKARTGTLWLLHGGPGYSGTNDLGGLAGDLPERLPNLDIVTLDHRGVGGSEMLDCPDEMKLASSEGEIISESEWPKCTKKLTSREGGLTPFTTTAAARDLGALIAATKQEGEQTFVWGGSYGTYLALRYLQLFPDQPDGVVLEGIAPPGFGFETFDHDLDEVAEKIFRACANDEVCASHLGADPYATARDVLASLDKGHCRALGSTTQDVKSFLSRILYLEVLRGALPAIVHRIRRCNDADVKAVTHLANLYWGEAGASPSAAPLFALGEGTGYSLPLMYHVSLSELWSEQSPTPKDAAKELSGLVIATQTTKLLADRSASWPKTPHDEHYGKLPDYRKPLLMLQGGLDPATPAKRTTSVQRHFRGPHQTWALFPAAAHDPTSGTYLPDGTSCARNLYVEFLKNPTKDLDLSCIAKTEGVTFVSDPRYAKYLFATENAWD